ncbi:MAG: DegT/DnrJ/EryC1/StrS family aminotransferase [Solirubrobacterales bacterium]
MGIPLFVTQPDLSELHAEVADRLAEVVRGGAYVLGPEVVGFEAAFADYVGAEHAVGVANGTEAITIALRALGIGPGDEVVVPAVTFYATVEAVVNAGATPMICDIDPQSWVMTAATAEPAVTARTACLLPVHLFGNPAPMAELRSLADRHGLALVADAAQAAGARYRGSRAGILGDVSTFSFYPGKNLGAMGDGGAVVTADPAIADRVRRLRFHGSEDKVVHTEIGFNSRLDSMQAAVLRIHLQHLDRWTAARRSAAATYLEHGLADLVECQRETAEAESCFHLMTVQADDRDTLRSRLADAGVGSRPYYSVPMHHQPALAAWGPDRDLPAAERLAARNLALPMGQSLTAEQVASVVEAIGAALGA